MSNTQETFRNFVAGAFALAVVGMLGSAAPATSAPSFDGLWSVVIVTQKGTCDRAYRYPVRIVGGKVVNAGDSPVTISGKVVDTGQIMVKVSHGSKSATGNGKLSGTNGGGSWSGAECSGTWEAERRGA
jgi:hypothetical protein